MAEEESSETTIIEERVEFMVDPTTTNEAEQNPTKRRGYFLKPSLNLNELPPKLPKIQSFSWSSRPNVIFLCRSTPCKGWQTWVEKLRQTQEPAWRKVGIFDAIKCSTYHIAKVSDLIFSLVEKWCPETNTFVFPWGEATVTLEDVFVLGGFSPLGVSVSSNSSNLGKDVEQVKNKLIMSSRKLKENAYNLSHLRWEEHFMGCGDEIEYAGFLSLWLVRHVFPCKNTSSISQAVFVLAARICCGAKLAFGPVVLASIYRELTLLKREILRSVISGDAQFSVSSPLHLVQVWAWERFPMLGPVPRMIDCGEVRLAPWESHSRKLCDDIDVNVGENSMEKSPPRDEFSPDLLQVGNDIGMEEDDEDKLWTTNRSMDECSKTDSSCSKLAEIELHRGIDQEEGGMELAEMLRERKQGCDAMKSLCSQSASKHQNLENVIRQGIEGAFGNSEDVVREQNKERKMIKHGVKIEKKSEYLEANILQVKTPTESNRTLIRVACNNEPAEALCRNPDTNHVNFPVDGHVTASLPVMDKSDQKLFAALCLEYEARMSRLERMISAT